MHRNYFTLYHAAMELHERLAGGFVFEVHSEGKNELAVSFVTALGEHLQVVIVSRIPELSVFTREGLSRKKRHTASLLAEVCEREVESVEMSPFDREILVRLAGGDLLVLRLYRAEANVFLVRDGLVADACRNRADLAGTPYSLSGVNRKQNIIRELEKLSSAAEDRFIEHTGAASEETHTEALNIPGFDRNLLRILAERWGGKREPEAHVAAFRELFYELLDPMPQTGRTPEGKPLFSILHTPLPEAVTCSSVLEGLGRYSSSMWGWLHTANARKELGARLRLQLRKTIGELQQFDPEKLAESAVEDETFGHLLMGALYLERNGPLSITVPDILNPGSPDVSIPLKPGLSLKGNASDYFLKASKKRGRLEVMQQRSRQLERRRKTLASLIAELDSLSSPKAVKRFVEAHSAELRETGAPLQKTGAASQFRTVRLSASAVLYIGKNAKNNEQLTFSFAKPHDIWLHDRGSAGSHCVLRGATLQHTEIIRKAAELAARHSAARHSELAPVMYTLKKYVRRSKNLPPGQVVVERENVILVSPARENE